MGKITYTNKVALNENPEVADINKVTDDDMNEIKSVVNTNDDNVGNLTNLPTTDKTSIVNSIIEINANKASTNEVIISNTQPSASDNKLWIDTGEIGSQVSEITNSYSTSTGLGYSANYINNLHTYSETEHRVGTWINGKPLYRKLIETTIPDATTDGTFVYKDVSIGSNYETSFIEWDYFTNSGSFLPIPYSNNSGYTVKALMNNSTTLRLFNSNTSWNGENISVCILYTKTTD